jgi:hypothetical protein
MATGTQSERHSVRSAFIADTGGQCSTSINIQPVACSSARIALDPAAAAADTDDVDDDEVDEDKEDAGMQLVDVTSTPIS